MKYPIVMFDWGDTVMQDDPRMNIPMYRWPVVKAIDGAEETLRAIHSRRTILLATSADQSDESEIRQALQRVNLNDYFDGIFGFRNTGLRKPTEEFYQYILERMNAQAADVLMVGNDFEKDVLGANRVGIAGVWLNTRDAEERIGERYWTIHRLHDLLSFLKQGG